MSTKFNCPKQFQEILQPRQTVLFPIIQFSIKYTVLISKEFYFKEFSLA